MRRGSARAERGVTYLWLLFMVAGMGVGLSLLAQVWHTESKRERERELLFVGEQFRRAIAAYHAHVPAGSPAVFPQSLDDLLEDRRAATPLRHLRKLYRDPMTGREQWGLIKTPDGGRIMGVYSESTAAPIKRAGFAQAHGHFAGAHSYADWKFVVTLDAQGAQSTPLTGGLLPQTPDNLEGGTLASASVPVPLGVAPATTRCDRIRDADQAACDAQGTRFDADTRAQCQASAQARAQACATGAATLPPLFQRY